MNSPLPQTGDTLARSSRCLRSDFPPVAFAALTKLAGAIAVNPRAVAILRTVTRESYVLVLCPEPARVAIALASALQRYDSTRKCQDSRQGEADCAAAP
jgi:hypothetical protein